MEMDKGTTEEGLNKEIMGTSKGTTEEGLNKGIMEMGKEQWKRSSTRK